MDRAGQQLVADPDLHIDRRVVEVGKIGPDVPQDHLPGIVRVLVNVEPLDAGTYHLGVIERPVPPRRTPCAPKPENGLKSAERDG